MSILEHNGSAMVAMKGKDCVAIASDTRFGVNLQTIDTHCQKIFKALYIGLPGLITDAQTVSAKLRYKLNMYKLKEHRSITPKAFNTLVSNFLYSHRFGPMFVEPVIAGLDEKTGEPYISAQDLIGAECTSEGFVVSGTASENLYGMCESVWKKDMDEKQLFETITQCLLAGVDRDAKSGWGGHIVVITKKGVRQYKVRGRQD